MDPLSTDDSIRLGIIIIGPVLSIVGCFFAAAIGASPYVNLAGKAIAFPLSPIIGLVLGSKLAASLLPGWGNWGAAMLFGHGFFYTWAVIALLAHDDSIHNFKLFLVWIGPRLKKLIRKLHGEKKSTKLKIDGLDAAPKERHHL